MARNQLIVPGRNGTSSTGIVGKFKTGLKLSRDSLGVIRDHPKLLVFPLLGALSTLVFWIVFLLPLWIANLLGTGAEIVVLFLLYFVTTFFATFFTASLVFAVNQTFHGEEPDLAESMRAAWRRKGPILAWSAIAAIVSVILKKTGGIRQHARTHPLVGVRPRMDDHDVLHCPRDRLRGGHRKIDVHPKRGDVQGHLG